MKPKILFVCDVEGWAWDIKSRYVKKYLEPYYDIDIVNAHLEIDKSAYDLYFTFGFGFPRFVLGDRSKCFTGLTAHRKKGLIIQAMNSVDHHHANSVLLYNELKSYDLKPFYLPNGVDENLFHPILPHFHQRSNLTIGHVGKKSPLKNQKKFIEPLFKDLDVDYNPCYNQFGNKVPHEQMVDKYQEFDLFLAASSEDGTPNGMLEAAACERATIINKIGNAPELIRDGHNGFLLNMDQAEYIDKIKWCQDNKDKVVEMGKNARQEILKGWTWELMSKNYLLMFDKVLGVKRDRSKYENPALYHIPGYYEEKE